MAFKRKAVEDILNDESLDDKAKVSKIMDIGHTELDILRDEIDKLTEQNSKLGKDLETASAAQAKAEKDFLDYKTEQSAKESLNSKVAAYEALLKEVGVSEKRFDLIKKATDFNALELDESGKLKDNSKLIETIKADYADFITTTETKGAEVQTPPASGGQTVTQEEFNKMSYKDRVELYNSQRELYDELITNA